MSSPDPPLDRAERCPICRKSVRPEEEQFPFCSRRCRVQDLANWANERYVIQAGIEEPEAIATDESAEPTPDGEDEP